MLARVKRWPEYARLVVKALRHRHVLPQVMAFIECPYQDVYGTVHSNEWAFLERLITEAQAHPGPIVEIGTLFGFSTQRIADKKRPDQKLITVDNYSWNPFGFSSDMHRDFTKKALLYVTRNCNTEIYSGDSAAFWDQYDDAAPALVFIDANHEYEFVKHDIQRALEKDARIISGHDYRPEWPSVQKAVDEFFAGAIEVEGSVWAHRR